MLTLLSSKPICTTAPKMLLILVTVRICSDDVVQHVCWLPITNAQHACKAYHQLVFMIMCAACMQVIGDISGDGRVVVKDSQAAPDATLPVDLNLEHVLGDMPKKTYEFTRQSVSPTELDLPADDVPLVALEMVLRLPAVGSKRFLTTKVDRCVTGRATPSGQGI